MFRINTCLLDAKLTQNLEDAILNVARVHRLDYGENS
jgi:hypothetical protein